MPTSPTVTRPLFPGQSIRHGDRASSLIALTFDDAPHPKYTPRLLALLRAEQVRATFFLVGEQLKYFPDLARQIVAENHEIGNHSLKHRNLQNGSRAAAVEEILGMQTAIEERVGLRPTIYRPAYGAVNNTVKDVCREAGLDIILWNVDTNDWRQDATSQSVMLEALRSTTSGSIILFHNTREHTVEAVATLIPVFRYRGFKMVTVSELLLDRAEREKARAVQPPEVTLPLSPSDPDSNRGSQGEEGEVAPVAPIELPILPPI